MKWIPINEKLPEDGQKIIVWQQNISDPECSRHHCAVYYQHKDLSSFIDIYPRVFKTVYKSGKDFKNYDLEGDMCQITHWMELPENPNN